MRNYRIFLSPPHMGGEEQQLLKEVFDSNYIAPVGPMQQLFEQELARYSGVRHAGVFTSGTASLHLVLRALDIGPGDIVLASTLTFIGGVSAINFVGATPVFIDSDAASWTMDPALLEKALAAYGPRVKAVVTADIYGQCSDYDTLRGLCDRFHVSLIADSAEAAGSHYKGRSAGSNTHAAILSFNGNKIITCSNGGAILTDDTRLIEYAKKLSTQAKEPFPYYEHNEIGYNYRLSNVLSAIGLAQLRVLDDRVRRRRAIFERYRNELGDIDGVSFMPEPAYSQSNRWLTVMLLDPSGIKASPEDVRRDMEGRNIETRPLWKPMHLQPVYRGTAFYGNGVSERLFERGLCLPSGSSLTAEDLEEIIGHLKQAIK